MTILRECKQSTQDIRRRSAACFVAVERDTKSFVGYYTIATSSLPLTDIAASTAKKLGPTKP
jgi:hypothetical protein